MNSSKEQTIKKRRTIDRLATGERLRGMVSREGLTIEQLSEKLGTASPQAIYRWFRGDALPSINNQITLMNIFQTETLDELFVFKEEEND